METLALQDAHVLATAMATDVQKGREGRKALPNNDKYGSATGNLLYPTTTTRPGIAIAVGILSRKASSPA